MQLTGQHSARAPSERPWPADHVERWPIDRLVPYARNARTHSEEQIAQIAASMREWGWTSPVLVDETGMIIAGHGRVLAARKLGIVEVPVMIARGWTGAQKRAYVLADNQLALNAAWDDELLATEIADLRAAAFDIDLIGFSAEDLRDLSRDGKTPADQTPEPPADPQRRAGRGVRHLPPQCLRQHPDGHEGRHLHVHVVVGARRAAEGIPRGRRSPVDLRHLG